MTLLASFVKGNDIQYHVFTSKNDITLWQLNKNDIVKSFYEKGYKASCIHFELDLAYKIGFTISDIDD